MDGNLPVPGWNAHRHPQEPLRPPNYVMKDVPKCARDFEGSVLQEIRDRDHFKEAMAEMVLLCTEAMRRTSADRCSAKPLSLEYIADRLDVDDPCFGYFVRSQQGMLQGFITVTTFTNWQKSFRWDSLHEIAFYYDESEDEDEEDEQEQPGDTVQTRKRPRRKRRVDIDGSLAQELQNVVRLGDPYNEGIVWPRIAEISLLGGLGCGKKLVQLVIEQLEFQKPSASANYDYIALQATDNSIPFYESLGFVRVGAVTVQNPKPEPEPTEEEERPDSPVSVWTEDSAPCAEPLPPSSPEKSDGLAMKTDIVSGPLTVYEVTKPGESPTYIANKMDVDVWDIIFLNKDIYKDIVPHSRLRKGTILHIPQKQNVTAAKNVAPTKWFVAKENDTPRKIAKKFGLSCKKLVDANKTRMPELIATSRLKEGTRVKITNLEQHDDVCEPYCHWSFPDDSTVEGGEPSYMMIYKLDRKTARNPRPIRTSLAVPIKKYSPPQLLLPRPSAENRRLPDPPAPPQPPMLAVDIYKDHLRELYPELGDKTPANDKILEQRWNKLARTNKARYNSLAMDSRKKYDQEYDAYAKAYVQWEADCAKIPKVVEKPTTLFNKVVKLAEDALEGKEYSYWFVLTYIPDLKWCHLAPMVPDGVFGPEAKRSSGRTKWKLLDESYGRELDISSTYCMPVKSRTLKKTADADQEEWDILEVTQSSSLKSKDVASTLANPTGSRPIRKQPVRVRSAVKPLGGTLAVVKPIKPASVEQQENMELIRSPLRSSTRKPLSPNRSLQEEKKEVVTRARSTPPRVSPRCPSPAKRAAPSELSPKRKKRKLSNSGTRRCALQQQSIKGWLHKAKTVFTRK